MIFPIGGFDPLQDFSVTDDRSRISRTRITIKHQLQMLEPDHQWIEFDIWILVAATSRPNVKFGKSTGNMSLLVVLWIPTFALMVRQRDANVGIGPPVD
jgi:hypothetical protein